jgi:hypothetical protein
VFAEGGADGVHVEEGSDAETALLADVEARMRAEHHRTHLPHDGLLLPFACAPSASGPAGDPLGEVHRLLGERRWREASDALRAVVTQGLRGQTAEHAAHLDAVCALWLGDRARARAAVKRARALQSACHLDEVEAILDALDGHARGVLGEYALRLLAADAHFAAGDLAAAREQADHAWMWRSLERQGLVRLAFGWLGVEATTPAERFRKRLVLATVCECDTSGAGIDVPLGASTWPEARWREVVARARAELG